MNRQIDASDLGVCVCVQPGPYLDQTCVLWFLHGDAASHICGC